MSKHIAIPRGTADVLPKDIPAWDFLESTARDWIRRYGFREIRTPIFEDTQLFKRSLGQTSDVVNKQLLELSADKEGFALRPEGTAPVVRSYIEHRLDKKEPLSKLFYIGPMFRGERPQKGRLRQFHQIGVEAIGPGTTHPYLDAEVISLAVNILEDIGIKNFKLKLNSLGTPEDKARLGDVLRQQLQPLRQDLCEDCDSRLDRNVFRVLDCKNKDCRKIVAGLDFQNSFLSPESQEYYAQVKKVLDDLQIDYIETPTLVRGLDYYTHTVFELSVRSLGSQDAVGAGGRYNRLVSDLGGPEADATGFALGIERLLLAMELEDAANIRMPEPRIRAFVITFDAKAFETGYNVLNFLRRNGVAAEISFKQTSMKSQMRQADKSGAPFVLILGEDELREQVVTLKNMQSGEQKSVSFKNGYESILDALSQ